MAPMTIPLSNRYRQIAGSGFIQTLTTTVKIDTIGTYYWSVQTIDTSFAGSSFSNEYSFTINDVAPVPGNTGLISSSTIYKYADEILLNWNLATDAISLTNSLEYRVYSSTTSYGDNISAWELLSTELSGWISNTNTFAITNQNESNYFVVIVKDELDNKSIYQPLQMEIYTLMSDIELTDIYEGSSAFGDYDNDGDLDLLMTGNTGSSKIAKLYQNSSGIFSECTGINLTGVNKGSSLFGDYDNDGDLDIFITGDTGSGYMAAVYQNTGSSFIVDI